jgi:probable phosphoglycerate mutase
MRLVLIRHGETESNAEGRAQGRRDVPLNARGRAQAAALAAALVEPLAAVVSSPASRCRQTAEAIATAHAHQVRLDGRLVELDFGELDGLMPVEFAAHAPDFLARWRVDDPEELRMPGGETMGEARARMLTAACALAAEFDGATVAVVSHQLALKALLSHALGASLAAFRGLQLEPASMSVVEVRLDSPWTVTRLNERCPVGPTARDR